MQQAHVEKVAAGEGFSRGAVVANASFRGFEILAFDKFESLLLTHHLQHLQRRHGKMAKVAKVKKREPTVHSRAHRRNASPPPKDLAVKAAPTEESDYKPWLHNAQNAGISKKKKVKQMSRQQKVRHQKAMEKADANLDKLATKVKDSKARARKVQARRADWQDLNEGGNAVVDGAKAAEDEAEMDESDEDQDEQKVELDVGMDGAESSVTKGEKAVAKAVKDDVNAESTATEVPEEDEEL